MFIWKTSGTSAFSYIYNKILTAETFQAFLALRRLKINMLTRYLWCLSTCNYYYFFYLFLENRILKFTASLVNLIVIYDIFRTNYFIKWWRGRATSGTCDNADVYHDFIFLKMVFGFENYAGVIFIPTFRIFQFTSSEDSRVWYVRIKMTLNAI